jgi:hypothetical protein
LKKARSRDSTIRIEVFIIGVIVGFIVGSLVNMFAFGKVEILTGFVGIIVGAFIGWCGSFKLYRIQRKEELKEDLIGLWLELVRNGHLCRYMDSSADRVKPLETQQWDKVKNTLAFNKLKRETYMLIEELNVKINYYNLKVKELFEAEAFEAGPIDSRAIRFRQVWDTAVRLELVESLDKTSKLVREELIENKIAKDADFWFSNETLGTA